MAVIGFKDDSFSNSAYLNPSAKQVLSDLQGTYTAQLTFGTAPNTRGDFNVPFTAVERAGT